MRLVESSGRIPGRDCLVILIVAAIGLATTVTRSFAEEAFQGEHAGQGNFFALRLATGAEAATRQKILDRYGVPFIAGTLAISSNSPARVEVGGRLKRIFLLGMTDSA